MTQVGKMLIDEGRQKGMQEGREEGRKEGDIERAKKTARNMLNRGIPLQDVAEVLELPIETIKIWIGETRTIV